MASLNRKDLVKNGKYNRAEIMKRAWAYYKNRSYDGYTFKSALHTAWVDAKMVLEDMRLDEMPITFSPYASPMHIRMASCSRDMRNGTVVW